jgi:phosphatidylserine synthase
MEQPKSKSFTRTLITYFLLLVITFISLIAIPEFDENGMHNWVWIIAPIHALLVLFVVKYLTNHLEK